MEIKFAKGFDESVKKLFSNSPRYLIPRMFNDIRYSIRGAYHRVVRGWDNEWAWNLHHKLDEYLPQILDKIRVDGYGYPAGLKNRKEWETILKTMADGFRASQALSNMEYIEEITLKKPKKDVFGNMSTRGYRINKRKQKNLEKTFDKGMKLFVEYYQNLWD